MGSMRKSANRPTGTDEYEQMIAEKSDFHPRSKPALKTARPKPTALASEPAASCENALMIAESCARVKRQQVRQAAYYIAQQSGFQPGKETAYWLQAETALNFR